MSTAETTCADIGCMTSPNCSKGPSCVLIRDRMGVFMALLADKLEILIVALTGITFAACAAIIVLGGHGEPAAVTLATMLTGLGLGTLAYIRLKSGQDRVEKKADTAAEKATVAAIKTQEIGLDAKAAKVAARVSVKQNVELDAAITQVSHDVNEKAKAVTEARAAGIAEGKASVIAAIAGHSPEVAATVAAKLLDTQAPAETKLG